MAGAFGKNLSSILNPIPRQFVSRRYSIAVACSLLAVILRWLLDPVLGHVAFYVTIHIVVAYCAIACGYAPAIVTALIGFVGSFTGSSTHATRSRLSGLPRFTEWSASSYRRLFSSPSEKRFAASNCA